MIGLILVLSGLLGSVIAGTILDIAKKFKATALLINIFVFLSMILFTFTLSINIWIIFGTSFLLGFFMTGYLPVGYEFAVELTYPESEGTSCGLLNYSSEAFGVVYTHITGKLISNYGALFGNIFICSSLFISMFITAFIKPDLRRQKAIDLNSTDKP